MKSVELLRLLTILETSNVKFISGKYFQNDVEIKNIDAYIKKICLNDSQLGMVLKVNDINEVKNQLKIDSDEQLWPDMPIIKKAKELGPITKDMEEANNAPFDLNDKQLLILNILLFHPDEEVMFITTGVGGSGKSTYLNIIKQIFGNDVASIPLSELSGFMVAEAVRKRLICSDELGKGDLDTKILKTLISKQELDVNPKYDKPYHAYCQSSLFYCCNKAPRIDVSDTGILRRIVFYERNTKIQNPNTSLNHKVYTNEELLWFVRRALAYDRIHSF